jgi:hypothetical protein
LPGDNTAVTQPCYRRTYGCIIPVVVICSDEKQINKKEGETKTHTTHN